MDVDFWENKGKKKDNDFDRIFVESLWEPHSVDKFNTITGKNIEINGWETALCHHT